MAKNKDGGRIGAIKERSQAFNPKTGMWVKFDDVTEKNNGLTTNKI